MNLADLVTCFKWGCSCFNLSLSFMFIYLTYRGRGMKAFLPNTDKSLYSKKTTPPLVLNNKKYPNNFLQVRSWIVCGSINKSNYQLTLTRYELTVVTVIAT